MKLRIQAGALTPVANIMVPPIVSADFSLGFWGTEDRWRRVSFQGYLVGLPGLHLLIPSIGTSLGFVRMVIMIPVLGG